MTGETRDLFKTAAQPFGWVAVLAIAFMVLITTIAVFARWLFRQEVFGVVDMMELALAFCIFAALPGVFLRDEHITVDLVDSLGKRRLSFALRLIGLALGLGFVALSLLQMITPALDKLGSGETTMTLQLPRWWHWIPILFGFVFSALAIVAVAWRVMRRGPTAPPEPTKTAIE